MSVGGFSGLTFLPLRDGPPAAGRQSTRDLFKVDVIVPILIEGVKQAWEIEAAFKQNLSLSHAASVSHTHTHTLTFTQ